jgi:FkbM family methyltransferase
MGFFKERLPAPLWERLNSIRRDYFPLSVASYSGEGEDIILSKIFGHARHGTYVDVGCYHPKEFSNTYAFYKKGWRGINIDANPAGIEKFKRFRPDDININKGVASRPDMLTYYMFNEPAVNTFSEELCMARQKISGLTCLGSIHVHVEPLASILESVSAPLQIDFMDIDVEGYDMEVLRSNNWNIYRPKVVLIEQQAGPNTAIDDLEAVRFLKGHGYSVMAKTFSTLFFGRNDFIETALL